MLVKDVLLNAELKLKPKIGKLAYLDVEIILADVLKINREKLLISLENKINKKHLQSFNKLFKRRLNLEPLAYVLGYKNFCDLKILINKNTLIPRPETEELVELVFNVIKGDKKIKIIDLITGSGAIALALKNKLPKSNILAIDNSARVLKVAKINAKKHNLKIDFLKSDLLKKINLEFLKDSVIVANLPYVDEIQVKGFSYDLKKSLSFEPKRAIFAKNNGTEVYEKLFLQIKKIKKENLPKFLLMEVDSFYYDKFVSLVKKFLVFEELIEEKDLSGRFRFIIVKLKK